MNAIESNGVQNPESVELATLAGGLVNIVSQLKTMGQMVKFLCDRYVLDHFDWHSVDFYEYCCVRFKIESTHELFISHTLPNLTEKEKTAACFEFIQFSHDQNQPDQ